MEYRLFTPEDFDDLYEIEEACFQPPFRFSRRYLRDLVHSPGTATWVAQDGEAVAGFGVIEWVAHVPAVIAYIATLEVRPEHRRAGVGRGILARLEGSANAEGAFEIWLHVDVANPQAIRLYEASGYRREGRAEHYYARSRPADIYRKPLTRA